MLMVIHVKDEKQQSAKSHVKNMIYPRLGLFFSKINFK